MQLIKYQKKPEGKTPLGQFLAELMNNNPAATTMHGTIRWQSIPVLEFVAAGLWIVMLKVGKTLGITLDTKTRVEDVSHRVNRLIQAGIMLCYGDPVSATRAFRGQVIASFTRALTLGYQPGMTLSAAAWKGIMSGNDGPARAEIREQDGKANAPLSEFIQIPAALFFAELVKSAREYGEMLSQKADSFRARNSLVANDRGSRDAFTLDATLGTTELDHATHVANILNLSRERAVDTDYWSIRQLAENLDQVSAYQEALLQLPVNPRRIPGDIYRPGQKSVEVDWVNTQILLAAGAKPAEEEYFLLSEFHTLAEKARTLGAKKVEDAFWIRMLRRNPKLPAKQLRQRIGKRVAAAAHHAAHIAGTYGDLEHFLVLCVIDTPLVADSDSTAAVVVDHQQALEIATGGKPDDKFTGEFLAYSVLPGINWKKVSTRDIAKICSRESPVAPALLAPHVPKMRKPQREFALQFLLDKEQIDQEIVTVLFEHQVLTVTWSLVEEYCDFIPVDMLQETLPRLIKTLSAKRTSHEEAQRKAGAFVRAVVKIGKPARAMFEDASVRSIIASAFDALEGEYGLTATNDKVMQEFKSIIGDKLLTKFVLAGFVTERSKSYKRKEKEINDILAEWKDYHISIFAEDDVVKRWVARNNEDDIVLWLYAADDAPKHLAAYQKLRTKYYAQKNPRRT